MERMVDMMKLTQKQQETVNRFLELENEYGKGNVFLRWINNYWNIMFVIHRIGEENFETRFQDTYKVNGKIVNALENKGLLQCQDINHENVEDPTKALNDGIKVIGSKILVGS